MTSQLAVQGAAGPSPTAATPRVVVGDTPNGRSLPTAVRSDPLTAALAGGQGPSSERSAEVTR